MLKVYLGDTATSDGLWLALPLGSRERQDAMKFGDRGTVEIGAVTSPLEGLKEHLEGMTLRPGQGIRELEFLERHTDCMTEREKGIFQAALEIERPHSIHVHVDASPFDARTLRNITNIMASKEDLIYKALKISVARENQYCQKVEERFLEELNQKKPKTLDGVERIWYNGSSRRSRHYDDSRYHCLNLHSVFQKGTVEFRLFNGTLHAGKIKAYIQFSLAISAQALNQACASRRKTHTTNEKYTFRTWLLRLGMIGDEFATARQHLLAELPGCIAWRDPAQAEAQKERLRQKREKERAEQEAQALETETPATAPEAPAAALESGQETEGTPSMVMSM